MRRILASSVLLSVFACATGAADTQKVYRWIDEEGVIQYGDSIPAKYAEIEKHVVNEHGITTDVLRGKKTPEEIAEEQRQEELRMQQELQRRADQALLATYLSVDEIVMHRDRRIELFQAQARVTELYLNNLEKRLVKMQAEASKYRPYSDDPDAEMIDPDLAAEIQTTKEKIDRHEANLRRFRADEQQIVARFDGDIDRFRALKGLD